MIKRLPLKTKLFKHLFFIGFLLFLVACSTKKNSFISRNSHALSTKNNILYNGQIGLDKGIEDIKSNSKDNFWKQLPIEKMQLLEDTNTVARAKNTNFELAEAKATKAIQKHSMNIGGNEKNSQIDEAHLLLGKARYYDQRFVPALDAFNYILYKYSNSDKIDEAKIWREKTNMRLGNDALVIKNITKMLENKKVKKQVVANANALLSEAFLNIEEKDSAIAKLKIAEKYTKVNAEKARYRFILGQLYKELGIKDTASDYFQSVIDMNRKADRELVMQAYAKKAQLFDYEKGDTTAFLKTYNKLILDRENRPFLDVIYHQMGVFYEKNNNQKLAFESYNQSLKKRPVDEYLIASNYRNLGDIYFKNTDYQNAAKYYDSTLVKLNKKTREYIHIQKVRNDLDEAIAYESITRRNDSIINVVALSESDRILYYENYIEKLKISDETKKIAAEKQAAIQANIARNNSPDSPDAPVSNQDLGKPKKATFGPPKAIGTPDKGTSVFYFYNPTTLAFGKLEFKKNWGNRASKGNWRLSTNKNNTAANDSVVSDDSKADKLDENIIVEEYTTAFYLKQLPQTKVEIDSIIKERNFVNYQLGIIYKEKFKEYKLAANKLEQLLKQNPEEKLVLPSLYNLYKIYQIIDVDKAIVLKNSISKQYPDSRYAQIINNVNTGEAQADETPESAYNKCYKLYEEEQFIDVIKTSDELINQFSGDEIVSKFELLKANTIGKLKGLEAYKLAMQFVADNYPNSEEGIKALDVLTTQIPLLEQINFTDKESKNWKILYKVITLEVKNSNKIEEKMETFLANEKNKSLSYTCDSYNEKESFIAIHGINSEAYAKSIAKSFKENNKYKIEESAILVSSENYKVIQIKKNLETYLAPKKQ